MSSVADTLDAYGKLAVELLKQRISSLRATGKTEESIRYEVTEKEYNYNLKVYGRGYFEALETGRGPRKESTYGEFDTHLEEWMEARGFSSKVSKKGIKYYKIGDNWYSGKSLAYMINKRGDKTYRSGGREVYSNELDKFITEMKEGVTDAFVTSVQTKKLGEEIPK